MSKYEDLLENKINISSEMEARAKRAYKEISDLLTDKLHDYDPSIFPQGSFRLGTIIRPLAGDDYDLDFVCLINIPKDRISPFDLKRMLGDALKTQYSTSNGTLEEMNRCWRVNLTNFHIDILPAVPETDLSLFEGVEADVMGTPIAIPDKELKTWKSSNPQGYGKWFDKQMAKVERGSISEHVVMNEADVAPLPKQNVSSTILQEAIKIMKYHRDVNFKDNPDDKPISIILTTLAADFYAGEQDIVNALQGIVNRIIAAAPSIFEVGQVTNPVLKSENFADKWKDHPERRQAFRDWVNSLHELTQGYFLANGDMNKINELWQKQFKIKNTLAPVQKSTGTIINPPRQWFINA